MPRNYTHCIHKDEIAGIVSGDPGPTRSHRSSQSASHAGDGCLSSCSLPTQCSRRVCIHKLLALGATRACQCQLSVVCLRLRLRLHLHLRNGRNGAWASRCCETRTLRNAQGRARQTTVQRNGIQWAVCPRTRRTRCRSGKLWTQ
jgi:hypothetical protein